MSDARYIFRDCVPDGSIDIANVQPGEILQRAWSFRVNNAVDLQQMLDKGAFDPRNIVRGYNGQLYDGDGNFLAEVNTWQAQISITNSDYQAAGQKITWALMQSYSVTLTFTETVVRDARLFKKLNDSLRSNTPDAIFNFTGVVRA
ncbi:endoglucanase [Paenibacillus sp. NPDC057967]|uniref:endoglucanase n=1 Tax=Paenibacillus sp. NPDC057967 TaxID=3346293 RepID=UPI0036DA87B4